MGIPSVRLKEYESKLNAVIAGGIEGEDRWVDLFSLRHCSELHDRVTGLLHLLSGVKDLPLIECARCGDLMVAQVPDNSPGNYAMEVCARCLSEMEPESA